MTSPPMPMTLWLASYPKSGNTWMRALYSAWRWEAEPRLESLEGLPIASSRRAFEECLGLVSSVLTPDEVAMLRPRADEVRERWDREAGELRVRKVHDAYFRGPAGEPIVSSSAARGAVYVVRDPRDVAVSFAHHLNRSIESTVDLMCAASASLSKTDVLDLQFPQYLGTWSDHVESWADQRDIPVLVVRYEDCLQSPAETWASVLAFAGLPVDRARVEQAVEASSFSRLQRQEMLSGFRERTSTSAAFFRAGHAGRWVETLPSELAARIEAANGPVMERYGYL